ncbi:MAG TPA: hypothetical protein VGH37_12435 [Candidatus Acidoferrum sp.]
MVVLRTPSYTRDMTLYTVSSTSPYRNSFRLLGWGSISLLFGVLLLSIFVPAIGDSVTHGIGWLAVAIVLTVIVGSAFLAGKESTWNMMRKLRFEIADGMIVKTHEDPASPRIEIRLNEIDSLFERHGWLFVAGGSPRRHIEIPTTVVNFNFLKSQLVGSR